VELHGGTVSVANNTPYPGATFTIVLPLRTTFAPAVGEAARRVIAPASTHLEDLQILVVDDDMQSRELFAAILENAGAHVRAAASTDDALALLATEWPDVLVSDIEMPNQDGYELLRRARLMEGARGRLPAVAVTAHARPDDHVRAMDNGFAWHMAKPVEPAELVKVVAMVAAQSPTVN
jgi:CheY-like chemotaxis protein